MKTRKFDAQDLYYDLSEKFGKGANISHEYGEVYVVGGMQCDQFESRLFPNGSFYDIEDYLEDLAKEGIIEEKYLSVDACYGTISYDEREECRVDAYANTFEVEAYIRGERKAVGKVYSNKKFLSESDLETIHDLANFGCSGRVPMQVARANYGQDCGNLCYEEDGLVYVPNFSWKRVSEVEDKRVYVTEVVNDNVFIHGENSDFGYAIKSDRRAETDEWVLVSKDGWLEFMDKNIYHQAY